MFKVENRTGNAGESGGKIAARGLSAYLANPVRSLAIATAAGLAIGFAGQALAAPPGGPTANEVYSDCTFDASALDEILNIGHESAFIDSYDNDTGAKGDIVASYIVIYRRDTQNNGQDLGTVPSPGPFTGPVVCVADTDTASANAESVPIPNDIDQPDAVSIDILATQGGSILQHRVNGGDRDGQIENRVCLSTDTGVDCVLVQLQ